MTDPSALETAARMTRLHERREEIDRAIGDLEATLDPHDCEDADDCSSPLSHTTSEGLSHAAAAKVLEKFGQVPPPARDTEPVGRAEARAFVRVRRDGGHVFLDLAYDGVCWTQVVELGEGENLTARVPAPKSDS